MRVCGCACAPLLRDSHFLSFCCCPSLTPLPLPPSSRTQLAPLMYAARLCEQKVAAEAMSVVEARALGLEAENKRLRSKVDDLEVCGPSPCSTARHIFCCPRCALATTHSLSHTPEPGACTHTRTHEQSQTHALRHTHQHDQTHVDTRHVVASWALWRPQRTSGCPAPPPPPSPHTPIHPPTTHPHQRLGGHARCQDLQRPCLHIVGLGLSPAPPVRQLLHRALL